MTSWDINSPPLAQDKYCHQLKSLLWSDADCSCRGKAEGLMQEPGRRIAACKIVFTKKGGAFVFDSNKENQESFQQLKLPR